MHDTFDAHQEFSGPPLPTRELMRMKRRENCAANIARRRASYESEKKALEKEAAISDWTLYLRFLLVRAQDFDEAALRELKVHSKARMKVTS
jgi:hypothetical protein